MKKINFKHFSLFGLVALFLLVLGGCGNGGNGTSESSGEAASSTSESTENETADAEKTDDKMSVVVATSGTSDIFSQIMPNDGTWTGIDGDVWEEIEARTDWDIEIKQVEFDGLIGELETGRADVIANHMEITDERRAIVLPSQPYSSENSVLIVKADNNEIKNKEDLVGKVVGVKSGQAVQPMIEKLSQELGFEVRTYQDNSSMYNDLAMDRTDVVAGMQSSINSNSEKVGVELTDIGEPLLSGNVGFFLESNAEGETLKAELDAVIQGMLDDGTIAKITKEWTGYDLTGSIKAS